MELNRKTKKKQKQKTNYKIGPLAINLIIKVRKVSNCIVLMDLRSQEKSWA